MALQPDVVLMDLTMPGMGGVESHTPNPAQRPSDIGVVVLTMLEDDDSVFAAMKAGARGYSVSGDPQGRDHPTVRAVADGEAVFGGGIAGRLARYFDTPRPPSHAQAFPELTTREIEILALMAQHLPNPSIAERLGMLQDGPATMFPRSWRKPACRRPVSCLSKARDAGLGSGTPTRQR